MSFLHAFDDMKENFFIYMKKFENDFLMKKNREHDKNNELRNRELDQNKVYALFFSHFNHHITFYNIYDH
jgi:hypothetical protein